jgi:hypothetical protein
MTRRIAADTGPRTGSLARGAAGPSVSLVDRVVHLGHGRVALDEARAVLRLPPGEAEPLGLLTLASCYANIDEIGHAGVVLALVDEALADARLPPDRRPDAVTEVVRALVHLGRIDAAHDRIARAVAHDLVTPEHVAAARAAIFVEQGLWDRAAHALRTASPPSDDPVLDAFVRLHLDGPRAASAALPTLGDVLRRTRSHGRWATVVARLVQAGERGNDWRLGRSLALLLRYDRAVGAPRAAFDVAAVSAWLSHQRGARRCAAQDVDAASDAMAALALVRQRDTERLLQVRALRTADASEGAGETC